MGASIGFSTSGSMAPRCPGIVSVSYTHLDVYKRQEEDFTEVVFRFTGNQYPQFAGALGEKTETPPEAAAALSLIHIFGETD